MEKKQSISWQLIEALRKKPMRYGQIQQFVWEAAGNEGKHPQGWWCTNIRFLQVNSCVIKRGAKDKKYRLTAYGKVTTKPFQASLEDRYRGLKRQLSWYQEKYAEMRHKEVLQWREKSREQRELREMQANDTTGFIGQRIVAIDELQDSEMHPDWSRKPACIHLEDGTKFYPMRDHEGNDSGVMTFVIPDGTKVNLEFASQ